MNAVHFAFNDRMVFGKMELRLRLKMALETGFRIFAGIDNEPLAGAAQGHVLAGGPVARFAAILASHCGAIQVQARVRTRREDPRNISVAVGADFVAHKRCAFNLRRRHYRPVHGGT